MLYELKKTISYNACPLQKSAEVVYECRFSVGLRDAVLDPVDVVWFNLYVSNKYQNVYLVHTGWLSLPNDLLAYISLASAATTALRPANVDTQNVIMSYATLRVLIVMSAKSTLAKIIGNARFVI